MIEPIFQTQAILEQNTKIILDISQDLSIKAYQSLYKEALQQGFNGGFDDFLTKLRGATFTPNVSNGVLSWTNDKDLENPLPVELTKAEDELIDLLTLYNLAKI